MAHVYVMKLSEFSGNKTVFEEEKYLINAYSHSHIMKVTV